MVPMPANHRILVGVLLFGDAVIDDQHPFLALDFTNQRLGVFPKFNGVQIRVAKKTGNFVVADLMVKQTRQPRSRRLAR